VQWIDVPLVPVPGRAGRRLLGDDPVLGERISEGSDDQRLGVAVSVGHEVDRARLECDLVALGVAGTEEGTRAARGRVRDPLERLHSALYRLTSWGAKPSIPGFAEAASSAGGRSPSW